VLLVSHVFSYSQINEVMWASSGSNHNFSMSRRVVLVCSVIGVEKLADYMHIIYHVSPPGNEKATMKKMKLRFRFKGQGGGKITVGWDRPRKYRNSYPHHKFGLGAVEIVHDLNALDVGALPRVSEPLNIPMCNCRLNFNPISRTSGPLTYRTALGSNIISKVTTCWAAS
jgi:hypothetical protein